MSFVGDGWWGDSEERDNLPWQHFVAVLGMHTRTFDANLLVSRVPSNTSLRPPEANGSGQKVRDKIAYSVRGIFPVPHVLLTSRKYIRNAVLEWLRRLEHTLA